MDKKTIAYWGFTGLLVMAMAGGGVMDLLHVEDVLVVLERLGYPAYLATIIGIAKLLGALVVVVPGLTRLKEWAYAGFVVDLIGAFLSHMAVGDGAPDLAPPLVVLAVTLASWALRPASRRLPGPTV